MTSKEFVLWLQGFTQGVHEHNITPKQWDALKDTLAKVNDEPTLTFPINTPNTAPHFLNLPNLAPNNPFTVNGNPVSFGTTTGHQFRTGDSSITYATPQFVTFTTSGTASGYPSGSSWSYTNG
jgi:hypothetical protein